MYVLVSSKILASIYGVTVPTLSSCAVSIVCAAEPNHCSQELQLRCGVADLTARSQLN